MFVFERRRGHRRSVTFAWAGRCVKEPAEKGFPRIAYGSRRASCDPNRGRGAEGRAAAARRNSVSHRVRPGRAVPQIDRSGAPSDGQTARARGVCTAGRARTCDRGCAGGSAVWRTTVCDRRGWCLLYHHWNGCRRITAGVGHRHLIWTRSSPCHRHACGCRIGGIAASARPCIAPVSYTHLPLPPSDLV